MLSRLKSIIPWLLDIQSGTAKNKKKENQQNSEARETRNGHQTRTESNSYRTESQSTRKNKHVEKYRIYISYYVHSYVIFVQSITLLIIISIGTFWKTKSEHFISRKSIYS